MAGLTALNSLIRMRKKEAREAVHRVRASLREARLLLLDLYEREGWRALGYANWRECCAIEFHTSVRHVYRLLQAAQVERDLTHGSHQPIGEPVPERQLRELARLPTAEMRAEVWNEATADGDTSAAEIRELVHSYQGHTGEEMSTTRDSERGESDSRRSAEDDGQGAGGMGYWRVTQAGRLVCVRAGESVGGNRVRVRFGDVVEVVRE